MPQMSPLNWTLLFFMFLFLLLALMSKLYFNPMSMKADKDSIPLSMLSPLTNQGVSFNWSW